MNINRHSRFRNVAVISGALLMSALCGQQALAAAPTEAQFKALQNRVQVLEDKDEIRTMILEYGHLLDTHQLAAYANQFASNGEWIGGFGRATGPKNILALMHKYMGDKPADPKHVMGFHVFTNIIIHVNGDHATAMSKLIFFLRDKNDKPKPVLGGHYDDTLVRENGHWKFLRRVVMMDIPYQDPRDIKGAPPPPPFKAP